MVELQLREEKTGRWLPGKKPGAGTNLRAGKKPAKGKKLGAGKTGASSSMPKKRAAPPRLQCGNGSREARRDSPSSSTSSVSLHKMGKEKATKKKVTSPSMAIEKVILPNNMSEFFIMFIPSLHC